MTDTPRRFLIVRLSSIGDIVHTLPAAAALGEVLPEAEIHWVVESRYAALLKGNPFVRRLVALDTLGWRRRLGSRAAWREIREGWGELRAFRYEAAIDFQGLWKSAAIARASRARVRIGFTRAYLREPGAASFYTTRVAPPAGKHAIAENLALVERLGARAERWQFPLPHTDADDAYIKAALAALGTRDFVIINPGGGWRAKCWSPENYAQLIRNLEAGLHLPVLLTGSPQESGLISGILESAGARRSRYLPTTLVQFIALARRAALFIGGDTGPLHLAAAAGTPIVGIFGPTDPARNGPFSPADIALSNQSPIDHTRREAKASYLSGISVDTVLAAAARRLESAHG